MFCSAHCEEAAWAGYHCLLCQGDRGLSGNPEALRDFALHADATNDIFVLASKAVARVALRATALVEECKGRAMVEEDARSEALFQARAPGKRHPTTKRRNGNLAAPGVEQTATLEIPPRARWPRCSAVTGSDVTCVFPVSSSLRQAWAPFYAAFRRLWWDSMSRPEDLPPEDEPEFRFAPNFVPETAPSSLHPLPSPVGIREGVSQSNPGPSPPPPLVPLADLTRRLRCPLCPPARRESVKRLAADSLDKLREALPRQAAAFPALFTLDCYATIIGAFELNNLSLVVENPMENYFLHIDGLAEPEQSAATALTAVYLDVLDKDYSKALEGTGLYQLVACANHSCRPNCESLKTDEDVDGKGLLRAKRRIEAGAGGACAPRLLLAAPVELPLLHAGIHCIYTCISRRGAKTANTICLISFRFRFRCFRGGDHHPVRRGGGSAPEGAQEAARGLRIQVLLRAVRAEARDGRSLGAGRGGASLPRPPLVPSARLAVSAVT